MNLADKAQASLRHKARVNAKTPVASLTPRTTEQGKRLANKIGQSQSLDGQLRASYNTPLVRTPMRSGVATPLRTPTTTRTKRSASDITPRNVPSSKKVKMTEVGSLTDGLL